MYSSDRVLKIEILHAMLKMEVSRLCCCCRWPTAQWSWRIQYTTHKAHFNVNQHTMTTGTDHHTPQPTSTSMHNSLKYFSNVFCVQDGQSKAASISRVHADPSLTMASLAEDMQNSCLWIHKYERMSHAASKTVQGWFGHWVRSGQGTFY